MTLILVLTLIVILVIVVSVTSANSMYQNMIVAVHAGTDSRCLKR